MFVIDYSMIAKSNFAVMCIECTENDKKTALETGYVQFNSGAELSYTAFRHSILMSLKKYNKKFKEKYDRMVIAVDDSSYWRRDVNPHYKGKRASTADASPIPWKLCAEWTDRLIGEIEGNFPYIVIQVPKAEADDVIGVMAKHYSDFEPVLIISRDHDFKQLNQYRQVRRYDPINDVFMDATQKEAKEYLFEHIVKGDRGDGIPNIFSPENIFVDVEELPDGSVKQKNRQKPLGKKKVDSFRGLEPDEFCADEFQRKRYAMNSFLIDLQWTPEKLVTQIKDKYDSGSVCTSNDNIFGYLHTIGNDDLLSNHTEFNANISVNPFLSRGFTL